MTVTFGRATWNQRTPPSIQKAISYFEKALLIYPNYAPAWAGLGTCHAILPITSDRRPRECFTRAREAAEKALTSDDKLPEALTAYGIVHFWFDWDWDSAERKFRRAIELNPSDSNARLFHAHLFSNLTRHAEALEEIRLAHRLDPLSRIISTHEGQFLYNARRFDSAFKSLERAIELDPNFWIAHLTMGVFLWRAVALPRSAGGVCQGISFKRQHGGPGAPRLYVRSFRVAGAGTARSSRTCVPPTPNASESRSLHRLYRRRMSARPTATSAAAMERRKMNITWPSAWPQRAPATMNASPAALSMISTHNRMKSRLRRTSKPTSPRRKSAAATARPYSKGTDAI